MRPNELPADAQAAEAQEAEALAEMIDRLFAEGTQHITLETGEETRIRTVNSTECGGRPGACAVPNFPYTDADGEKHEESE